MLQGDGSPVGSLCPLPSFKAVNRDIFKIFTLNSVGQIIGERVYPAQVEILNL